MTKRRGIWLTITIVTLTGILVLTPGTPMYLADWYTVKGSVDGRAPQEWLALLESPEATLRHQAISALGRSDAVEAMVPLATIVRDDPSSATRAAAAAAVSKLARPTLDHVAPTIISALAVALTDDDLLVRAHAAEALARFGAHARPAVPALIAALADKKNEAAPEEFPFTVQEAVIRALGRSGAGAEVVPALIGTLKAADTERLVLAVVHALGEVGNAARPAGAHLRPMLTGTSTRLRQTAATALRAIEGENGATANVGAALAVELPEAEREYLWAIEHRGNVLGRHGFGPLAKAIQDADASGLSALLAAEFAGADLRDPHRTRSAGFAEVERLQDSGHPPLPLDRAAFVGRLLEFRKVFPGVAPQVQLRVMTLSPKVRGQLDGAWGGTAQLRLHGEHAPGAPAEVVTVFRFELPHLTEEALTQPGWLTGAAILQTDRAKAPRYFFTEVARQRGLDTEMPHDNWKVEGFVPVPGGVYVCDFDRDGILDVLITDINGVALYRGRPNGQFEDVTLHHGLPREGQASQMAAWVDIDGDGWEDLILAGRVYRNEAGQRFTDYTNRCMLRLPSDGQNIAVADYDRDGKLDLYVTRNGKPGSSSWLDTRSDDIRGNYLLRNLGGWKFEDVTAASGAGGGHRSTFTAAWLDANNDGWPDLHVINEFGDGVLLVNQGDGTFAGQPLADRPADFGTMGLAVGDVNNDGNIDIYCANMYSKAGTRVIGNLAPDAYPPTVLEKMRRFVAGSQLHLNKGGLKFEQAGTRRQVAAVGWAYGACLADLDNDGWLDVYATAGFVSRDRTEPDG